ncbi:DUF2975 domain-containing protein [Glycomyces tarimensis]
MRLPEGIRRPDWLKEVRAVLVLALVAVAGLGLIAPAATAVAGDRLPLELPGAAIAGTIDFELRENVAIADDQHVTVTLADPDPWQRAVWASTELPGNAVVAALLALLLWLVRHARREDPFTISTVRRLRLAGVVAIAGGYLGFILELTAAMYLSSTMLVGGSAGVAHLPVHWLLIGFGLFAIAEVVNRGCAMRAELETVV